MFIEIVLAIALGVLAGITTGLIPGLHINLVALILFGISPFLLGITNVIVVVAFIISMSITHTFTDFISATYLGAPSDDTALAVLPAHKLLLEGKGHEAIRLTLIGSLLCLIIIILLSPILIIIVPFIFKYLKGYMGWILLVIVLFMVFKENSIHSKTWAFVVVLMAGSLGLIVFSMPNLKDPLLPMLSGLFGLSVLFISLTQKVSVPLQHISETINVKVKNLSKAIGSGIFSGSLISIFPGLGPAQAAVLAGQIVRRIDIYSYLILVGGINTVSMILSLITLFTIQKARNGSIIVVQQLLQVIDINMLMLFLAIAMIAGSIATFFTLIISKIFSKVMNKVNYSLLSLIIILFIIFMVFYFSGFIGFIILVVATAIGIIPNVVNISRSISMACLIVPIILVNLL
jgi:putative membrane protein